MVRRMEWVSEGSRILNEEFRFSPEKQVFPRKIFVYVLSIISIIRQV
jgi:hypothetical protein